MMDQAMDIQIKVRQKLATERYYSTVIRSFSKRERQLHLMLGGDDL